MTHARNCAPIRVAVTHGDACMAAGIASLLRSFTDMAVFTAPRRPEVVDVHVTDHAMGLASAAIVPCLVVAALSSALQIRQALEAGVRGYLLHGCTANELAQAVRALADGRTYLSDATSERLLGPSSPLRQAATAEPMRRQWPVEPHPSRLEPVSKGVFP